MNYKLKSTNIIENRFTYHLVGLFINKYIFGRK